MFKHHEVNNSEEPLVPASQRGEGKEQVPNKGKGATENKITHLGTHTPAKLWPEVSAGCQREAQSEKQMNALSVTALPTFRVTGSG